MLLLYCYCTTVLLYCYCTSTVVLTNYQLHILLKSLPPHTLLYSPHAQPGIRGGLQTPSHPQTPDPPKPFCFCPTHPGPNPSQGGARVFHGRPLVRTSNREKPETYLFQLTTMHSKLSPSSPQISPRTSNSQRADLKPPRSPKD